MQKKIWYGIMTKDQSKHIIHGAMEHAFLLEFIYILNYSGNL